MTYGVRYLDAHIRREKCPHRWKAASPPPDMPDARATAQLCNPRPRRSLSSEENSAASLMIKWRQSDDAGHTRRSETGMKPELRGVGSKQLVGARACRASSRARFDRWLPHAACLDPRPNLIWNASHVGSMRSLAPRATSRPKGCTRFCKKDCVAKPYRATFSGKPWVRW